MVVVVYGRGLVEGLWRVPCPDKKQGDIMCISMNKVTFLFEVQSPCKDGEHGNMWSLNPWSL